MTVITAQGRARPARKARPSEMATRSPSAAASRIGIPPVGTATSAAEKEVQAVARVELLMLKGVRRPDHLMTMLGLPSLKKTEALIALVNARWEVTGGGRDLKRNRGEALHKLDLVESEMWVKFSNADGYKAQASAMKAILQTIALRNEINGLAPKVMERLAMMPDATNDLAARVTQQSGIAAMATRLAEIIAERRRALGLPPSRIIDHASVSTGTRGENEEDAEA